MADTKGELAGVKRDLGEVRRSLDLASTVVALRKEVDALTAEVAETEAAGVLIAWPRPAAQARNPFIIGKRGIIYPPIPSRENRPWRPGAAEFSAAGAACSTKGAFSWRFH